MLGASIFWALFAALAAFLVFWLTGNFLLSMGAVATVVAAFALRLSQGLRGALPAWNRKALGVPTLAMLNYLESLSPVDSDRDELARRIVSASWVVASLCGSTGSFKLFTPHATFGPFGRWIKIEPVHAMSCFAMVVQYLVLTRPPVTDEMRRLLRVAYIDERARKWAELADRWGDRWVAEGSVIPTALMLSALNGRFPEGLAVGTVSDTQSTREMARLFGYGCLPVAAECINYSRFEHGVLARLPSGRIGGYDGAVATADYLSVAVASYVREVDALVATSFDGLGIECITGYLVRAGSLQNDPRRHPISGSRPLDELIERGARLVRAHREA